MPGPICNRFLSVIALLLLTATWRGVAEAQTTIISGDQLVEAAEAVSRFKPRDQFDAAPAGPAWAGQRFTYTVKPVNWSSGTLPCSGMPTWSYREGTLSIRASSAFINPFAISGQFGRPASGKRKADFMVDLNLYSITCRQDPVQTIEASNAFGAKLAVAQWADHAIGVIDTSQYDTKWRVYWNGAVEGAVARDLANHLAVRVSGTLQAWPNGRTILCGIEHRGPRISSPTDLTLEVCAYSGRPDTIEFVNAATGQTIYEVRREPLSSQP